MVTVKDIASRLGVSPSTVTRALAGNPRISEKTRKLVCEAAEEMGYIADTAAKMMRSRQSTLIGLLIPDIENSFYAQIAKAFSDVCNENDYQLSLAVSDDDPAIEERHIRHLISSRCAGIAIVPTADLSIQSAALLKGRNVAQLIRRNESLSADWYGINDVAAIRTATNSLLDLGHRRIALICGQDTLNSARDRYAGYVCAFEDRGLNVDPTLVFRGKPRSDFGYEAVQKMVSLKEAPTAIIAAGAGLSEGMLNAASTWVQDDRDAVSLIGYSDCTMFKWWGDGGLTAIDLPISKIATELCTALINRSKAGGNEEIPMEDYLYDSRLIMRGSVKGA